MPFFDRAEAIDIHGGTFTENSYQVIHDHEQLALEKLERHSTGRAFYDSKARYDPPKCHPQTREAVFQEIQAWLRSTSTGKPILWIYGPAGAGKSAIAQSVAEKTGELGYLLVASFFFNRSDGERNTSEHLIPSIAYQMISSLPSTRPLVLKSVNNYPQLFSLNTHSQLKFLIAEPLSNIDLAQNAIPMLILVDGLDECLEQDERMAFLHAVKEVFSSRSFPLAFLCTSRPESDIRGAFNDPQLLALSDRIVLDNHFKPDSDIKMFLDHEFTKIKTCHPLGAQIPHDWPSESDLQQLVRKSSGQFIYAATVIKQVASRRHIPMEQLQIILGLRDSGLNASPFKELDTLYLQILSSIDNDGLSMVIRILGLVCVSGVSSWAIPLSPRRVDTIFNLAPGQTGLLLQDLHSLINVTDYEGRMQPFHASLGDFLTDRSRSGIYYVNPISLKADNTLLQFEWTLDLFTLGGYKEIYPGWIDLPKDSEAALLTDELYAFFERLPWERALPKQGLLPAGLSAASWIHDVTPMFRLEVHVRYALDAYLFCNWASNICPERWSVIHREVARAFGNWIIHEIASFPLDATRELSMVLSDDKTYCLLSKDSWERQRPLKAWAWRLYASSFAVAHDSQRDWFLELHHFIRLVLQEPILAGTFLINRAEHNFILHNNILHWYVYGSPSSTFDPISRYDHVCIPYPEENITAMLDSTDRAACIDKLFHRIEKGGDRHLFLSPNSKWGATILRYKAKPIPADYDYDFQLRTPVYRGMKNPPYLFVD